MVRSTGTVDRISAMQNKTVQARTFVALGFKPLNKNLLRSLRLRNHQLATGMPFQGISNKSLKRGQSCAYHIDLHT